MFSGVVPARMMRGREALRLKPVREMVCGPRPLTTPKMREDGGPAVKVISA
ncbi:MAG: hypothetical protein ACI9MR_003099 [Myxococcota bacterium]|jgi:hypothetical protein